MDTITLDTYDAAGYDSESAYLDGFDAMDAYDTYTLMQARAMVEGD